jgi:hypothetical protein
VVIGGREGDARGEVVDELDARIVAGNVNVDD